MISLCALLLIGAAGIATAGAQTKPTLAVFVVGMSDNNLGNSLATQVGSDLNRASRYTVVTGEQAVQTKLNELRTQGADNIDRNALAAWGRANNVSTICLVTDAIKGSEHIFSAQLIDAKDSKLSGRGSYTRTNVVNADLPRVSLALAQQLGGAGRKHSASERSHPAEVEIEMVRVEGGTYTMGCVPERDGGQCGNNEFPARSVKVSSFYIGKYEVTQAQWKAVMRGHALENCQAWKEGSCGAVPCDDQRPMENVSWNDINTAFLPRLNALTGKSYRLPTEAEWEYAARGCIGDGKGGVASCENFSHSGGGSNDVGELAWYQGNSGMTTHPVGQKKPNRLGIYDMCGNVWERVYDWDGAYTNPVEYDAEKVGIPNLTGPATGTNRVCRGCSWNHDVNMVRVAFRASWGSPNDRFNDSGFRLVLPAQ
ncbi:MAG: formylglycine-generating enzyme family protein [Prevotellaceae bacterium]|nr:formylglycine-generating enzyme family protein [Prevotellaceae bacterium]